MNAAFGSISVTSTAPPLQSARYFAAVAPPYPAPTTTTFPTPPWRPIDAQPPSETGRAMPHPIANLSEAELDRRAREIVPEVVKLLLSGQE